MKKPSLTAELCSQCFRPQALVFISALPLALSEPKAQSELGRLQFFADRLFKM